MAAYSLICSAASTPSSSPSLKSPTRKPSNFTLSKPFLFPKHPNFTSPLLRVLRRNHNLSNQTKFPLNKFNLLFTNNKPLFPALDSLFVLCISLALSVSFFLTDADVASAFVVTSPRKLQTDELATVRLFQENTPSVVYITNLAVRQDAFTLDVLEVPQGSGSGFVWDVDGHIVTNYHVIRNASDLRVTLADQSTYEAKVVGFDQDKDVAVLRVDAPQDKLRPIPVGISADLLVGQKVFAIGNPVSMTVRVKEIKKKKLQSN